MKLRNNKVYVGLWVKPGVRRSLKALAKRKRTSMSKLLTETALKVRRTA